MQLRTNRMITNVDDIYLYALKLLKTRDLTVTALCQRLDAKFGQVPGEVLERLTRKNFLNDRRFAENYVERRKDRGGISLREELIVRGVSPNLAEEVLANTDWPS